MAGALCRSSHDRRLGAKNRAERGWLHPNGDHGARVSVHREEWGRSQPIQAAQRYGMLRNVVNSGWRRGVRPDRVRWRYGFTPLGSP